MAAISLVVVAEPERGRHRTLVVDGRKRCCIITPDRMTSVGAPATGLYHMRIETVKSRREANAYVLKRDWIVKFQNGRSFMACYLYPRRRTFYGKHVRVTFEPLT